MSKHLRSADVESHMEWEYDGQKHKTWYRITGDIATSSKPTLITAHGGPGCSHDYILTLADLAVDGRAVVHYDQVGGARSSRYPEKRGDVDFWTVPLFVYELTALAKHLGLDKLGHFCLGQSWGAALVQEYALSKPPGLKGAILADGVASVDEYIAACDKWRSMLPAEVEETLRRHEAAGTTDSKEYHDAAEVFNDRHGCRVKPTPAELVVTHKYLEEDDTVYKTMHGPSEFHCTGPLKVWTSKARLPSLRLPVLVLYGEFDECSPDCAKTLYTQIPGAKHHCFDGCSHLPHIEAREDYMKIVNDFFTDIENNT